MGEIEEHTHIARSRMLSEELYVYWNGPVLMKT
jgi:hypothetical protein